MTTSIRAEVHNISQRRQRRTEPRPRATCTKNLVKFGRVVFELCERTNGVVVHPDCWCVCLCYFHFASENPEDGEMYLLVPAHPGYPRQSPESRKMFVCVVCERTNRQTDKLIAILRTPPWGGQSNDALRYFKCVIRFILICMYYCIELGLSLY